MCFDRLRTMAQWAIPILAVLLAIPILAMAQDAPPAAVVEAAPEAAPSTQPAAVMEVLAGDDDGKPIFVSPGTFVANNVWLMICAGLVFLMHLGFAALESGLCRSKNTVNILTKNVAVACIGILTYFVIGFNLMYPGFEDGDNMWLKFAGFGLSAAADGDVTAAYASGGYTYWTDFLFQAMFAATAATIVSGAVAERIKLMSFMIFTVLFVTICYPIIGSWKWGGGWLDAAGFHDFAGSTLVHSVGGWGALAGIILLGPRLGKYNSDGSMNPIPGHSMPLAVIGVMLLWLGWFGFNGGSVLSADPAATSYVLVTTCLAAAAGAMSALFTSYFVLGNFDLSMLLNGVLAGLVGITAGADVISPNMAVVVGLIAGVIIVLSVVTLDKLKLDDPVGAVSVHLVCGIWGTLAVGIFGWDGILTSEATKKAFMPQVLGVLAGVSAFVAALLIFGAIKATMGIRVPAEEEAEGLDLGEHGMEAYPDFTSESLTSGAGAASSRTAASGIPAHA